MSDQQQLELIAGIAQISCATSNRVDLNGQWIRALDERLREVHFMLAELLTPEQQQRAGKLAQEATQKLYEDAKVMTEFRRNLEDLEDTKDVA